MFLFMLLTCTSIYVAKLDGALVKTLVDRNPKGFAYYLAFWLGVALPATYINSMIRVRIFIPPLCCESNPIALQTGNDLV